MRRLILARADEEAFAAANAETGTRPLLARALELVDKGITTRDEVERVFGVLPGA
jgi:type II secretory ATPase GspE/PulE/Tfp pilus assembly ATPase PilB-like protein